MRGRRFLGVLMVLVLAPAGCGDDDGGDDDELPDAATGDPDGAPAAPDGAPGGPDGGAPGVWVPPPETTWQWQLTGTIDTSIDVAMYDIDLVEAPQAVIDELRAQGRVVICYFSAGSVEDWRPDAGDFPPAAIGETLDGWPDERWLDVRDPGVRDVMRARLDLAVAKRCDGVEPDNVDGYANASGFPLTGADQLDFNRFLAAEAHARGLSVGLKNDLDQIPDLVGDFDWALNEECVAYSECDAISPFIDAGKAVFHVEYGPPSLADSVCPVTGPLRFSTLIKNLDLDAPLTVCP